MAVVIQLSIPSHACVCTCVYTTLACLQQAISLVALALSRAVNVYPCTALVNALRTPETRVPPRHSFMLWFSGLRGAMAFALSLQAAEDLPGRGLS